MKNVYAADSLRLVALMPLYIADSWLRRQRETLGQILGAVTNWWDVVFVYLGISRSANAHMKNGVEVRVAKRDLGRLVNLSELANLPESAVRKMGLRVEGGKATMSIGGKRLVLDLDVAAGVAMEMSSREHSIINVRGRDVVDVGAYLDDTAIYYVLSEGARHVYAFEPLSQICGMAIKNVKANGLASKISTFNLAVSGTTGRGTFRSGFGSTKAGAVSLDEIVRRFGLRHAALKLDCEGYEYGIVSHASSEALMAFDLIHIEYHYGYRDLVERLRMEGYRVTHTKPVYNFMGFGREPLLSGHVIAAMA